MDMDDTQIGHSTATAFPYRDEVMGQRREKLYQLK